MLVNWDMSASFLDAARLHSPRSTEESPIALVGDIGISRSARPHAYADGYYSSIEQYQYNDKEPIGVQLVFEHQPVVGETLRF